MSPTCQSTIAQSLFAVQTCRCWKVLSWIKFDRSDTRNVCRDVEPRRKSARGCDHRSLQTSELLLFRDEIRHNVEKLTSNLDHEESSVCCFRLPANSVVVTSHSQPQMSNREQASRRHDEVVWMWWGLPNFSVCDHDLWPVSECRAYDPATINGSIAFDQRPLPRANSRWRR
jgi:hypothetical protein